MSLVVGMKVEGRVLMAADRRFTSQTTLYAPAPKLHRIGWWVLGITGALADSYLFRRDLPPNVDFSDPIWYFERIKMIAAHGNAITESSGHPNGISFQVLAARDSALFMCTQDGVLWPTDHEAIGSASLIAQAFLNKHWTPAISVDSATKLAAEIFDYAVRVQLDIGDGLDVMLTEPSAICLS